MLDAVGLPEPDGAVYAALVAHPNAGAAELARVCDLPVSLAGRSLARLVREGLASRTSRRVPTFVAAAPDVVIGSLIGHQEEALRQARSTMHTLMETYRETSRFTHPALSVEVLTGRENISHRVNQLQEGARHQVRGFDRPPYLSDPGENLGRTRRRLREGISYRIIYDRVAVSWPHRMENDILIGLAEGEHARVRPELPMKMIMADARQAVIPVGAQENIVEAAYVIHPSSLLDALITLFEAEWERGVPVLPAPAGAGGVGGADRGSSGLDETSRRLLALLAAGLTDEAISRSLGWSFRTTQRRLQALMRELGATTRFQAGMTAKERGWL